MKSLYFFALLMLSAAASLLPAQTAASAPSTYYRVRISFNTRADWASLETSDPRVLLNRKISAQGNPNVLTFGTNKVLIGQDLGSAMGGNSVGLLVD